MGQRRWFTPEFKRQAVQLLNAGQLSAAEIARELGSPRPDKGARNNFGQAVCPSAHTFLFFPSSSPTSKGVGEASTAAVEVGASDSTSLFKGVAKAALYCARRTTTALPSSPLRAGWMASHCAC
jgi:hypothetical protein